MHQENLLAIRQTRQLNDLERANKMAFSMVAYYGMSDNLYNISYYTAQQDYFQKPYSDVTAKQIDDEVKTLIAEQYERAKRILTEHSEGHGKVAQLLIDKEVIFAEDVEQIFGKRQWTSRSDEIIAENERLEKERAEAEAAKADEKDENLKAEIDKLLPDVAQSSADTQGNNKEKEGEDEKDA